MRGVGEGREMGRMEGRSEGVRGVGEGWREGDRGEGGIGESGWRGWREGSEG